MIVFYEKRQQCYALVQIECSKSGEYMPPRVTFHEERCRPSDSLLQMSPRITKDIVKIPYKEPKKKHEETGPQDLDYSSLFFCPG